MVRAARSSADGGYARPSHSVLRPPRPLPFADTLFAIGFAPSGLDRFRQDDPVHRQVLDRYPTQEFLVLIGR